MAHLPKGQGVFLPPFKAWLASNIPAVYDNTMTYYEELCALIKYLQDVVIPALNHNAEAVTTIATAVEQLQKYVEDYFKNLDVQEEINNKLDAMAEAGTLQEIIGDYLNATAVWGFNSVADMKASTNLIDGSFAHTLGYYAKNDGGSATYKIRKITNDDVVDEATIIEIGDAQNSLIAELITNEYCLQQFGCYGDGTHDDTTGFARAVACAKLNNKPVVGVKGSTYLISQSIQVDNIDIDLKDSTVKTNETINELFKINIIDDVNQSDWYGEIKNVIFDCTNVEEGLNITMGRKKHIENCKFINVSKVAIYFHSGYEVFVNNCHIRGVGSPTGNDYSSDSIGIMASGGDSHFENIVIVNCATAIYNRGLNFYNNIHAWTWSHALSPDAIFIRCGGNVPAICSQIYADTFGKIFSMRDAWIIVDQLYVFYNSTIYEDTYTAPKLWVDEGGSYSFTASYQSKSTLTNSDLRGVGSRSNQQLQYRNWTGNTYVKTDNNNVTRVQGYIGALNTNTLSAGTHVTSIASQRIAVRSDMVNLNVVAVVDNTNGNNFTLTGLPTRLQPNGEVNTGCFWGDNNINDTDGYAQLKISGDTITGTIKGASAGTTAYVKINVTYPVASFSIEY